jgi:hypothetical protein
VPRGDPVDGVGIVRYPDAVPSQLVPKSYRPRAGGRRRLRQRRDPLLELLRPADEGLPDPLPRRGIERGEDLAAAGVEDSKAIDLGLDLRQGHADRVERADARRRQAEAGGQPAGGGDADPQPGEGAGAEADDEAVDPLPPPGRGSAALDLLEQRGGVPGGAVGGGPQQRLVQSLAVAPGAGGGVGGRRIEADERQRSGAPSP